MHGLCQAGGQTWIGRPLFSVYECKNALFSDLLFPCFAASCQSNGLAGRWGVRRVGRSHVGRVGGRLAERVQFAFPARPNNSHGSGKANRDILAVGDLSFPPITLTCHAGALLINGQKPVLDQARWYPYQALQAASAPNLLSGTAAHGL
jgi:hypothetical protein